MKPQFGKGIAMEILGQSDMPLLTRPSAYFSTELDAVQKVRTLILRTPLSPVLENGRVLIYVASGSGTITINGLIIRLETGNVCSLLSSHVFSIAPDPNTVIELKCVAYDYPTISYLLFYEPSEERLSDGLPLYSAFPVLQPDRDGRRELERCIKKMEQEDLQPDSFSEEIKSVLFFQILMFLSHEQIKMAETSSAALPLGWKIFSFIENFSNQWMSPQEVAQTFGISVRKLNYVLRSITSYNASQLMNRVRLNISKTFLLYDNVPLCYVANATGFKSEAAFISAFKAYHGETPKEYRDGRKNARFDPRTIMSEELIVILQYIIKNFRENVSVRTASAELYISEKRINKLMENYAGVSFKAMLVKTRLIFSRALLLNGDMQIGDISETAGFPTAQTFWRQFKAAYHCSPTEYRERHGAQ